MAENEPSLEGVGVAAVFPTAIMRQRLLGWPDFHPEEFCHRCGGRNLGAWWVDSALWNEATEVIGKLERERGAILCPQCFVELWESENGPAVWELHLDVDPRGRKPRQGRR